MDNVAVLDTPEWTAAQALLAAKVEESSACVIVVRQPDGCWQSITGGKLSSSDLLLAAEVIRRRALRSIDDWYS